MDVDDWGNEISLAYSTVGMQVQIRMDFGRAVLKGGGKSRRWQFPKVGAASADVFEERSDVDDSSDDDQESPNVAVAASTSSRPKPKGKKSAPPRVPTPASTPSTPAGETRKCDCCGEEGPDYHPIHLCREFRKLNLQARNKFVREHQNCWLCLKTGHLLSDCTSGLNCKICRGPHNTLLHRETANVGEPSASLATSIAAASTESAEIPI